MHVGQRWGGAHCAHAPGRSLGRRTVSPVLVARLVGRCPWSPLSPAPWALRGWQGRAGRGRPSAMASGEPGSKLPSSTPIIYSHRNRSARVPDSSPRQRRLLCPECHGRRPLARWVICSTSLPVPRAAPPEKAAGDADSYCRQLQPPPGVNRHICTRQ